MHCTLQGNRNCGQPPPSFGVSATTQVGLCFLSLCHSGNITAEEKKKQIFKGCKKFRKVSVLSSCVNCGSVPMWVFGLKFSNKLNQINLILIASVHHFESLTKENKN